MTVQSYLSLAVMALGRRQTESSPMPAGFIFGFFLAFNFIS